jgi:hypothetical protein
MDSMRRPFCYLFDREVTIERFENLRSAAGGKRLA